MGNGTSIGRVRGLGSAHEGAHHWLLQRFAAIGNLVLALFLAVSLALLPNYSFATRPSCSCARSRCRSCSAPGCASCQRIPL